MSFYKTYNEFIGSGYGEAVFNVRKERAIEETLARLGGDQPLMYESHWEASDDRYDDESYEAGSAWKNTTLRAVLTDMAEYDHRDCYAYTDGKGERQIAWRRETRVTDFSGLNSLSDVSSMFCDVNDHGECGVGSLHTVADAEKVQQDRIRVKLEQTAAAFARECGYKVGTREYVQAANKRMDELDYRVERWNSDECRMERYAACSFAGCRDSYWADNDYVGGKFAGESERLGDVLRYMEDNFPLLMLHIQQEADATAQEDA
jgi:hypothetical protein